MDYRTEFIALMVEAGVLTFGDFTTKSGRKTPYFINTGNYKTGGQIARLGDFYAERIAESGEEPDALFGPAYKGIPLVTAASASLYRKYGRDIPFFFNRKEEKDHGERGRTVGYCPKDGDRVAIVEDVVTAGTAVRESLALFRDIAAQLKLTALYVSVDRMERGRGAKSALRELEEEFGIRVYPIVTVRDIIRALDGTVIDAGTKADMEAYLRIYGAAE